MTKPITAPIDPQTFASLRTFAEDHGANWRTTLQRDWLIAKPLTAYPGLYRLRNTHGPVWLDGFEFAPVDAPARRLTASESAKLLKVELRRTFPGVQFSVRLSRGTAYGNANIAWENGPSEEDVEKVANPYEGATFDGMTDSMNHRNVPITLPDGKTVLTGLNLLLYQRKTKA